MSKKRVEAEETPGTTLSIIEKYGVLSAEQAQFAENLKENLGGQRLDASDLDMIKMPKGGAQFWELPSLDGRTTPSESITGILIYSLNPRWKYRGQFGDNSGEPPCCISRDGMIGIGDPGGACDICQFNQFGSAIRQDGQAGRGKACKEYRFLFVLLPGSFLPAIIRLSVMSIQAHKQYVVKLAGKNLRYYWVETEIGLKAEKNKDGIGYSEVTFRVNRTLEGPERDAVQAYINAIRSKLEAVKIEDQHDED